MLSKKLSVGGMVAQLVPWELGENAGPALGFWIC